MVVLYITAGALAVAALLTALYLFAIGTCRIKGERARLLSCKFAHRGYHGDGAAENSLTACERAVQRGYGIEIDVRFSKDRELVVFHDAALKRVCGVDKLVSELTLEELKALRLGDTEDKIPTLRELLCAVDGRVPLLIEIKQDLGEEDVASAAAEALKDYKGDLLVQSFNPRALAVFKKKLPTAVRGILSDNFSREAEMRGALYFLLKNLVFDFLCRPHFISFNYKELESSIGPRIAKRLFSAPLFAWTVRSREAEAEAVKKGFDTVIFEDYEAEASISDN